MGCARRQIQASVEQAMGHCRRDNLWRRLFHGEHHHLAMDKLKLSKLSFSELEELLNAVQSRSVEEIDPQLVKNTLHLTPLQTTPAHLTAILHIDVFPAGSGPIPFLVSQFRK